MLEFEYCECGCKGSESATLGRTSFWIYNDLAGSFYLHQGHGMSSTLVKQCGSHEEAAQLATELMKPVLEKEQAVLDEIRRQLEDRPVKALTFEQVLRKNFPGPAHALLRRVIRASTSSSQIRDLIRTRFSDAGRDKLEEAATAFETRGTNQ
jgi:hypothetical protein